MLNGKLLKERRERLNIQQKDLAEMIGLRPETLSRYEHGSAPIPRRNQIALDKILNDWERGRVPK